MIELQADCLPNHVPFKTYLTEFQAGVPRMVYVPRTELAEIWNEECDLAMPTAMSHVLDLVFHYGQNEIQSAENRASISAGDVIRTDHNRYFVYWKIKPFGFEMITEDECDRLRVLSAAKHVSRLSPLAESTLNTIAGYFV